METINLPAEIKEKVKKLEESFDKVEILDTEERNFDYSDEIKVFYKTPYTTGILTMITVRKNGTVIISDDGMAICDLRKLSELVD